MSLLSGIWLFPCCSRNHFVNCGVDRIELAAVESVCLLVGQDAVEAQQDGVAALEVAKPLKRSDVLVNRHDHGGSPSPTIGLIRSIIPV